MSIPLIQGLLSEEDLDGWLFFDFHHRNDLMWEVLQIPKEAHITRRVFYFVPKSGSPVKIVSKIESHVLEHLPGELKTYATRDELKALLQKIRGRVAMEYSTNIPYISMVDAGTVDYLRSLGMEVVSSGGLLQKLTGVLTDAQIASHREAAKVVDGAVSEAFSFVGRCLRSGKPLFEGDVQKLILEYFSAHSCVTDHPPIVARGANSANPHYTMKGNGDQIKQGDFLLVDLWCRKKQEGSIFADITRVACTKEPTAVEKRAFDAVRGAQKLGVAHLRGKAPIRAADVDTICRSHLESLGYGANVFHRTGHNIGIELHGNAANFDSFETFDDRVLVPKTCYSVEPAVYIPNEFGLRLEHDVLYLPEIEVTGGVQDELLVI